jgi:hypothetical protein
LRERKAFDKMHATLRKAARGYLKAIDDDRWADDEYLDRVAGASARCAKEGGGRTLSWEWLKLNPAFAKDFTMFDSVEAIEATFEWLNLKNGLRSMRIVTAVVRRNKRESAGGLNTTPGRKRNHGSRPKARERTHTAEDVFFACNYLIRTGCRVSALAKMFGVAAKSHSHAWFMDRVTSTMWYWCRMLQARFKPELLSKKRVQNRAPAAYVKHFHNRIRRIIDGLPIYTEMASSRKLRRAMYNKCATISLFLSPNLAHAHRMYAQTCMHVHSLFLLNLLHYLFLYCIFM